jgi:hypothetical protein
MLFPRIDRYHNWTCRSGWGERGRHLQLIIDGGRMKGGDVHIQGEYSEKGIYTLRRKYVQ